jgi:hypothetical protein
MCSKEEIINMITRTNISRRSLLSGLVYLGSFGFLQPGWTLDKLHNTSKTNTLASELANFYVDKESAKIVGLEYLRSVPSEANVSLLVELLCSFDREQHAAFAQTDRQKLRELLLLRQRQDFEDERVVNVRGWLLSKTECRLCALAALI